MNTLPRINKAQLLERVIAAIQTDLDRLQSGLERAKAAKFESATRMQSRYDTFGVESGWVADGLAANLSERQEALRQLSNLKLPDDPRLACVGSVAGVGPLGGSVEDLYFILPAGGGLVLAIDGPPGEINIVTPQAPIVRKLAEKGLRAPFEMTAGALPAMSLLFLA